MSGDVRAYDPTQLPPNLHPQNFNRNENYFSPNTVHREIQDAINRYPQPYPWNRIPLPQSWHKLPVPYQSLRKPSSPTIPKAPVKSKEREQTSYLDLDSTYTIQGRHPVPRRHLSFHEDILDTSDSNISRLFQENENLIFVKRKDNYEQSISFNLPQDPSIRGMTATFINWFRL